MLICYEWHSFWFLQMCFWQRLTAFVIATAIAMLAALDIALGTAHAQADMPTTWPLS